MFDANPYFMEKKEWYYHDEKEWRYKLTEEGKRHPKVVKSYEEFYFDDGDDDK